MLLPVLGDCKNPYALPIFQPLKHCGAEDVAIVPAMLGVEGNDRHKIAREHTRYYRIAIGWRIPVK
jgi:hypothetical protein